MERRLELEVAEDAGQIVLRSPEVGLFTRALPRGAIVAPGETAGVIVTLGRAFELVVPSGSAGDVAPEGARGEVVSDPPERVHHPVGYGDVLYRLAPVTTKGGAAARAAQAEARAVAGLVLRAPQSGRFYHRPAPSEAPFVTGGATIAEGAPVGMIEVMKTFSHVPYRASGGLPARARVVRILARDGADVRSGDPLVEVEPAG